MMKYLLSNPKAALGFVAVTCVSTVMLIGSEDDEGLLAQAVEEAQGQGAAFDREAASLGRRDDTGLFGGSGPGVQTEPAEPWGEFATDGPVAPLPEYDDSLIDQATGYDPTPSGPTPFDPSPESVNDDTIEETIVLDGPDGSQGPMVGGPRDAGGATPGGPQPGGGAARGAAPPPRQRPGI